LSISLLREASFWAKASSWVKARLAQARDSRLSESSMVDGFCLKALPRRGTPVLGEGSPRPSEKKLTQARLRGLQLY